MALLIAQFLTRVETVLSFFEGRLCVRPADRLSEDPNQNAKFLEVFQKIDVYVVLVLTNIIIGQLNTKLYDSDNGMPKFCICENLETHFHLVLFEHWHETRHHKEDSIWKTKLITVHFRTYRVHLWFLLLKIRLYFMTRLYEPKEPRKLLH